MYEGFDDLVNGGPGGAGLQLAGTADGAAYAAAHPKEFAKAVTNWEEWQRNPLPRGRAAHPRTSPRPGLRRRRRPAQLEAPVRREERRPAPPPAGRERALRRDGSARDRVDDGPANPDTCKGDKCEARRPDRRRHRRDDHVRDRRHAPRRPSPRVGAAPRLGVPLRRLVRPPWASTLDQRLWIDDQGIRFITDDGMLLNYPVPEPESRPCRSTARAGRCAGAASRAAR